MKKNIFLMVAVLLIMSNIEVFAYKDMGEKFQDIVDIIERNYYDKEKVDKDRLFAKAVNAMLKELDPYSAYVSDKELEEFKQTVNKEYVGIGVSLVKRAEGVVVEQVFADGPADKAGIKTNDIIKSVDGEEVTEYTPKEVSECTRGEKGKKVQIKVIRKGVVLDLTVVREKIVLKSAWREDVSKLYPELDKKIAEKIGYIVINSFSDNLPEVVGGIVEDIENEGKKDFILDFRNNGGGSVFSAVKTAEFFTNQGYVVTLEYNNGRQKKYFSSGQKKDKNIVCLINENSASATEFVVSAIQRDGGKLVGETTYGKGIAQSFYSLQDGDSIKLSVSRFYVSDGEEINEKGVAPDYVVPAPKLVKSISKFHIGDTYSDVFMLEKNLKFLGYNVGKPDKYYDVNTANIVALLQQENGLYSYGVCDYTTQDLINKLIIKRFKTNDIQLKKAVEVLIENME